MSKRCGSRKRSAEFEEATEEDLAEERVAGKLTAMMSQMMEEMRATSTRLEGTIASSIQSIDTVADDAKKMAGEAKAQSSMAMDLATRVDGTTEARTKELADAVEHMRSELTELQSSPRVSPTTSESGSEFNRTVVEMRGLPRNTGRRKVEEYLATVTQKLGDVGKDVTDSWSPFLYGSVGLLRLQTAESAGRAIMKWGMLRKTGELPEGENNLFLAFPRPKGKRKMKQAVTISAEVLQKECRMEVEVCTASGTIYWEGQSLARIRMDGTQPSIAWDWKDEKGWQKKATSGMVKRWEAEL